jgi:hypothetical protein
MWNTLGRAAATGLFRGGIPGISGDANATLRLVQLLKRFASRESLSPAFADRGLININLGLAASRPMAPWTLTTTTQPTKKPAVGVVHNHRRHLEVTFFSDRSSENLQQNFCEFSANFFRIF